MTSRKPTRCFGEDGFSLIEVLVTAVIMAIGLLAMAQMQIVAIRSNADTRAHTEATNLAIGHVEYLKNLSFSCPEGMVNPDEYWLTDPADDPDTDTKDTDGTDNDVSNENDSGLFDETNLPDHVHPEYPVNSIGYPIDSKKEKYGMFWNIEDYEDEPLKAVTVTVSWYNGPRKGKKHVTFSTIIADPR